MRRVLTAVCVFGLLATVGVSSAHANVAGKQYSVEVNSRLEGSFDARLGFDPANGGVALVGVDIEDAADWTGVWTGLDPAVGLSIVTSAVTDGDGNAATFLTIGIDIPFIASSVLGIGVSTDLDLFTFRGDEIN